MPNSAALLPGKFYHIYNRGINGENLFLREEHFLHFLGLYTTYIDPIAETLAWTLMPDHFHLLVRIKENISYKYMKPDDEKDVEQFDLMKWETISSAENKTTNRKPPVPFRHFAHLFNAYTKYLNQRTSRFGKLFESTYKSKKIDTSSSLKNLLIYVHHNPVHHGLCKQQVEYPWSSYLTSISVKPTKLQRKAVMGWFDNEANFVHLHNGKINVEKIEGWFEL
jgi:REP element-mobilizing transposase RayT